MRDTAARITSRESRDKGHRGGNGGGGGGGGSGSGGYDAGNEGAPVVAVATSSSVRVTVV